MIGGLSSSLALAQRTATKARATMDTMARQIATGQRVSSVKDDGAAWARAAGLKSQKATNEARTHIVANLKTVADIQSAQDSLSFASYDQFTDIIVAARALLPGSSGRQALAADWARTLEAIAGARSTNGAIVSGSTTQADGRWGVQGPQSDPLFANQTVWTVTGASLTDYGWQTRDWAFSGVPLVSVDIANGSDANLGNGLANVQAAKDLLIQAHSNSSDSWLDRTADFIKQDDARLDTAIGSLTDADLGAASTQLRQSETRQQLALDTISRAISAYGNFAGGLLGNVQRTQRAIA
jgi:flagellin